MSRSISTRIAWGYGILILLMILTVFCFVVHVAVDKLGGSESAKLAELQNKAGRVLETAALPSNTASQTSSVELGLRHGELMEALERLEEMPGRFFLPESLIKRYSELRSRFLREQTERFRDIGETVGAEKESLQLYIEGDFFFLEELHSYAQEARAFRHRLSTILIVFFSGFIAIGVGLVVFYFFFSLPGITRDYRILVSFSRALGRGAVQSQPVLSDGGSEELAGLFNQLLQLNALKTVIVQVQDQAIEILHSCMETEAVANLIYESETKQADLLEDATSGFSEIVAAIQTVCDQARSNHRAATDSGTDIESSTSSIVKGSDDVRSLEEHSIRVEEITTLIADIADQTDLLALNASIEAARAGEFGRGFSVVALEVQKLADRSAKATQEISELVQSIRDVVKRISVRGNETNLAMGSIRRGIGNIAETTGDVAGKAEAAAAKVDRVNASIDSIMNLSLESLNNTDNVVRAFQSLRESAERLTKFVEGIGMDQGAPLPALRKVSG